MNKYFKAMVGNVLNLLGITAFVKNEAGAATLTAEQKQKVQLAFGKKFTDGFSEALPMAEDLETNPSASDSTVTELMNNLREHHATNLTSTQGVEQLRQELATANERVNHLQTAVDTMADSAETLPQAQFPSPGANPTAKKAFKVDARNPLYVAANSYLNSGNPADFSAATIEVGDLRTEFGKYLSQDKNNLEIRKKIFSGFTSAKFFTVVRAVTEWRAIRSMITSISQQFTAKWTPSKGAAFKPMKIVNRRHKINLPIVPAQVLDSYMFKLYDESLSPDQMPITRYIIDELVYPALMQDIEMRMIYKGKFVDHESELDEGEAAPAPEDSMDGLETIIIEAKAAGNTGMHFYRPSSDFTFKAAAAAGQWQAILDHVNGFVDWLSPFYKTSQMPIFMSDDDKRIYKRAYKKIWGVNSGQDGDFGNDRVDYSNQILTAPDGMFGSSIMFTTPKANQMMLRHINEVPNIINDVQKHGYEVRIFGEYWLAVGFAFPAAVFAYCPTSYTNPQAILDSALGAYDTFQDDFNVGDGEISSTASGI